MSAHVRFFAGEVGVCAYCGRRHVGNDAERRQDQIVMRKDARGRTVCNSDCDRRLQRLDDAREAMEGEHEADLGQQLYG